MNAAHKKVLASMIEDDDSKHPTNWEKNQLIDQLVAECRTLKQHCAMVQSEPECADQDLHFILGLNRGILRTLCAETGRSFEALKLDGRQQKKSEKKKTEETEDNDESCRKVEKMDEMSAEQRADMKLKTTK